MAQGKKYSDEIKERAFALLSVNDNVAEVARQLELPRSTVKTWKEKWEKQEPCANTSKAAFVTTDEKTPTGEGESSSSGEITSPTPSSKLAELRQRKKEEFVERAWSMMERSQRLIERRLTRAEEEEAKIDELMKEVILNGAAVGLVSQTAKNAVIAKLAEIKLESTKSLAVLLGTLYDKQALAAKEPTVNVSGGIAIKFEDL